MSDYNIAEAARQVVLDMHDEGIAERKKIALNALQVAQAEAFGDVIDFLEMSGHRDAANLLLTKVEAVWCRRTEQVTPATGAAPTAPGSQTPVPPAPGRLGTHRG